MTIELESFLQHNSVKCSNCKYKFEVSIEVVLEFEQENKWNGLLISTPTYIICEKCKYDK